MQKLSWKSYCDIEGAEESCTQFKERGKAMFCAAVYPTEESRSAIACERVLEVAGDSFLRRPSVSDLAMETIMGFVNEGTYILQEPGKRFRSSASLLFLTKGIVRVCVAGEALLYHFRNGAFQNCYTAGENEPFGTDVRLRYTFPLEFDVTTGENAFLLCSGTDASQLKEILPDAEHMEASEQLLLEEAMERASALPCSAVALVLPERKRPMLH